MKDTTREIFDHLFVRYPVLSECRDSILSAFEMLQAAFASGNKVLVCGNGGSAADAEHIVGELLNKFKKQRPLPRDISGKLRPELALRLQAGLPAISLVSMCTAVSAIANDASWDVSFAQQIVALARPGDVLFSISTSGNSENCVLAAEAMNAICGKSIALTKAGESRLGALCDIAIKVPATETYAIQELHLPVYHTLCAMLEEEIF